MSESDKKAERRYVIRKYVMAASVKEALEKEPGTDVGEVFVDDKQPDNSTKDAIGFKIVKYRFPYEY